MKLTKHEKLAIAGQVAPVMRDQARNGGGRTIVVVNRDGTPVRRISALELAKAILRVESIEFETQIGIRPTHLRCEQCGRRFARGKKQYQRPGTVCADCKGSRQKVCAGSNGDPCPDAAAPDARAFNASRVELREGRPWRCRKCIGRLVASRKTPEQFATQLGHMRGAPKDKRIASLRDTLRSRSAEWRSERSSRAWVTRRAKAVKP